MVYIVIDSAGAIVNRIVLDDPGQWQPPEAHTIIEDTENAMMIGGSYIDGVYTPPVEPELKQLGP